MNSTPEQQMDPTAEVHEPVEQHEPVEPVEAAVQEDPLDPPPPPPPTPPAPVPPDPPVTFGWWLWYTVTFACLTATCPNQNLIQTHPEVYSNNGNANMSCGVCNKKNLILSATLLNPQPEES